MLLLIRWTRPPTPRFEPTGALAGSPPDGRPTDHNPIEIIAGTPARSGAGESTQSLSDGTEVDAYSRRSSR